MAEVPTEQLEQALPAFPWPDVELFLAEHYGISGEIEALDSDPPSYLVRYDEVTSRLEFSRDPAIAEQFQAQAVLLQHMHAASERLEGPQPLEASNGTPIVFFEETEDYPAGFARVCAYPSGVPQPGETAGVPQLGTFAARLIRDLAAAQEDAGEEDPIPLQAPTDLRQAGPAIVKLLREVTDPAVRDPIAKVMVTALRKVQALGPDLRAQLIHHHPVLQDVVGTETDGAWVPTGFTDPSALGEGWVVASLAAICAELVGENEETAFNFLPAVIAFHAELPLTEPELEALWPLTIARIGLMLAETERRLIGASEAEDADVTAIRHRFETAIAIHPALVEAAVFDALDLPVRPEPQLDRLLPDIKVDDIRLVDLSTSSAAFADGNWQDPDIDWRLLARIAWDTKLGATRFGEYRLSRSHATTQAEAENVALHVDLCVPAETVAVAPFGGIVHVHDGLLTLTGKGACLHLEGLDTVLADGTALFAGDRLGVVAGAQGSVGGLRIRLGREALLVPPLFVSAGKAAMWRHLALSPSLILGIDLDAPAIERNAFLRGYREHVFDGIGRPFVDLSGGAGLLGHGHAGIAEAAWQQWMLLNGVLSTPVEREFQAALLQRMPGELDTVVALTSESLAADLARQLGEQLFPDEGSPIIADERRSGFGRSGQGFWQFEQDDRRPDIVITGSPVPGEPLSAVIVSRAALPEALGLPQPDASMVACRLGAYVIDALDDPALRDNAANAASHLMHRLTVLEETSEGRLTVEGSGLALDLVVSGLPATHIAAGLLHRGILVTAAGDDRLQVTAPLCITLASLDRFVEALAETMGMPLPAITNGPQTTPGETPGLQGENTDPI